LQIERDRFVGFAFAAADVLMELDDAGAITFAAGTTQSLLGHGEKALLGLHFAKLVAEADRPMLARVLARLEHEARVGPFHIRLLHGRSPTQLRALRRATVNGGIQLVVSRTPPRAAIASRSHDAASGLLGRDSFTELAERHLDDCREQGGHRELTMIRLRGLDQSGLAPDSQALRDMMASLGGLLRSVSIDGDAAGLLGEGVFGVVNEPRSIERLERQIKDTVAETAPDLEIDLSVRSIAMNENGLMPKEASQALVHVLKSFAGQLQSDKEIGSLGEALEDRFKYTVQRIADFRQIVRNLEFDLVYQPIVDLVDRRPQHYEALSRFRSSESPGDMVGFAEKVGITVDFDLAVVRKVLDYLSTFDPNRARPKVAVNLSTRSIEQDAFLVELKRLLAQSGRLSRNLTFEITESAEIQNLERTAKILADLRAGGNKISLDDFGAGASAFHYIRALKIDQVKVDGDYIKTLLQSERDASIVVAMTNLCRSLKVVTVAEMIETEEQAAAVARIGVDLGQGWLFGRPAPQIPKTTPATLQAAPAPVAA